VLTLPDEIMAHLAPFAPLFTRRTWRHVPLLVAGAILAPGARMVSSLLRVLGLDHLASFQAYHRVLNRAVWSSLGASRIVLGLLVATFAPDGPLVVDIDETLERRRGTTIGAAGIYRDPVRSSHGHFVKARALRWISLLLLVPIPWAGRTWALPFLRVLAPSARYDAAGGRRHKTLADWARQLIRLLHIRPVVW
jgi:DDE superfamily endonuclease